MKLSCAKVCTTGQTFHMPVTNLMCSQYSSGITPALATSRSLSSEGKRDRAILALLLGLRAASARVDGAEPEIRPTT